MLAIDNFLSQWHHMYSLLSTGLLNDGIHKSHCKSLLKMTRYFSLHLQTTQTHTIYAALPTCSRDTNHFSLGLHIAKSAMSIMPDIDHTTLHVGNNKTVTANEQGSPWMHSPLVSKCDPWQAQSKVLSFGLYMTLHFKCGHTAENVFSVPSSSLYAATLSRPTCIAMVELRYAL